MWLTLRVRVRTSFCLQENPIEKHRIAKIANWVGRGDSCVAMKTKSLKSKLNAAFSLVELLVVIAVIAVIAGIAIPNIAGTREAAITARDAARLEEQQRFLANIQGAGNTNAVIGDIVDGFTWTNAQNIVFTYNQNP